MGDLMTLPSDVDEAAVAEEVATVCENSGQFSVVDWNDLGEVTVKIGGRTFRACFSDITDEAA